MHGIILAPTCSVSPSFIAHSLRKDFEVLRSPFQEKQVREMLASRGVQVVFLQAAFLKGDSGLFRAYWLKQDNGALTGGGPSILEESLLQSMPLTSTPLEVKNVSRLQNLVPICEERRIIGYLNSGDIELLSSKELLCRSKITQCTGPCEVMNQLPIAVLILKLNGAIEHANPAAIKALNLDWKDVKKGKQIQTLLPECDEFLHLNPAEIGQRREIRIRIPGMEERIIGYTTLLTEGTDASSAIIVTLRETTDLKAEESKKLSMEQSQLIANILSEMAHKLKNNVFGISALSYGILQSDDENTKLSLIHQLIDRCRDTEILMKQLLEQRRLTRPPKLGPLSINQILREVVDLYTPSAKMRIRIDEVPLVNGDKHALQEVFQNLIVNGIQAAEQNPELTIICDYVPATHEVEVEIKDNGPGLNPAFQEKAFLPFFTTKKTGSGMGLTICKQIISSHNGSIKLINLSSGGCLVRLRFPVLE